MAGEQARLLFFLYLLFFLDKKSNKKVKANPNGSARFAGQRTGEYAVVGLFIAGKGMVQVAAACWAGQREVLCFALQVFIEMYVFNYGGPALRRGKQGAGWPFWFCR